MKSPCYLISFILIAASAIAFSAIKEAKVLAVGCDTYYRVTGQISGCSSWSTEDARNIWLEKYSACLEQQLSIAIADYNQKLPDYYAQWQEDGSTPNIKLDDISLQDLDKPSLSLSEAATTTYSGSADFCQSSK
ncbi:MAG: hypothetical protein QNJ53_30205 [Pleurocapsa sp. MO_192.B19]|nr:hypothetical protein [Pleurocapsa sp. MO_192.B19]